MPLAVISRDKDVGGLDVPMHEPARVRRIEGARDVTDDPGHVRQVHQALLDDVAERHAGDVAHCQIQRSVVLAAAIDRDDVGMVE